MSFVNCASSTASIQHRREMFQSASWNRKETSTCRLEVEELKIKLAYDILKKLNTLEFCYGILL